MHLAQLLVAATHHDFLHWPFVAPFIDWFSTPLLFLIHPARPLYPHFCPSVFAHILTFAQPTTLFFWLHHYTLAFGINIFGAALFLLQRFCFIFDTYLLYPSLIHSLLSSN